MTNKEKARQYVEAVNSYDKALVEAMVHENYIQHNPHVPTGRAAFVHLLSKLCQYGSKIENFRMLEDNSHIIMHHRWTNAAPFGADTMVAFHIIRIDGGGLIAEHWSVATPECASNPSGRTLIDGERQIIDAKDTEKNKTIVTQMMHQIVKSGDIEGVLPHFFHGNFYQHHPLVADGISGLSEALKSGKLKLNYIGLHKVFGEGNFALAVSEGYCDAKHSAIFDLYRLKEGKIAEHWSVAQECPTENLANDNTRFNFK